MLDLAVLVDVPSLLIVLGASFVSSFILYTKVKPALDLCSKTILGVGCLGAQIGLVQALAQVSSPDVLLLVSVIIVIPMLYAGVGYALVSTSPVSHPNPVGSIPLFRKLASLIALVGVFLWAILVVPEASFFDPLALIVFFAFVVIFGVINKGKNGNINFLKVAYNTLVMSIVWSSAGLLGAIARYADPTQIGPFLGFAVLLSTYATSLCILVEFFYAMTQRERDVNLNFGWQEFLLVGAVSIVVPITLILGTVQR
ncbi:MAG: hypothetical protein ACO3IL_01220 [Steroidobacteraceae bacterium]